MKENEKGQFGLQNCLS